MNENAHDDEDDLAANKEEDDADDDDGEEDGDIPPAAPATVLAPQVAVPGHTANPGAPAAVGNERNHPGEGAAPLLAANQIAEQQPEQNGIERGVAEEVEEAQDDEEPPAGAGADEDNNNNEGGDGQDDARDGALENAAQ
mmetsp:Transcript_30201/g.63993  ORF Transcript_30201/g.63993 Transcript_30201/m.63993 type:complete len:140 (-) Transcript_30201:179-598(-)